MSDEITHRLSTEGVDPLALAGVNDGNLVELARRLGVRVSLRGDTLMLQGALPAVERATQVAQALVELARMGETLEAADIDRIVSDEAQGSLGRPAEGGDYKIILPGLRRVIQPKTAGQREYLQAIVQHDIVIGIGPAGTGKTYLAVAAAVDSLARGFRLNHAPQARQNDLHEVRGDRLATSRKLALRFVCHHALDVVDVEVFAHAREIDQRLGHRARALDRRGGSRDGQRIPTQ